MRNIVSTDPGSFSDMVSSSTHYGSRDGSTLHRRWKIQCQSTTAMFFAAILAIYGSGGLWDISRNYTQQAIQWSSAAEYQDQVTQSDAYKAIQAQDRIDALKQWIDFLSQETKLNQEEARSVEKLAQILDNINMDELEKQSDCNDDSLFCDVWSPWGHFNKRPDTTHWKVILSDANSAEQDLEWLSIRLSQKLQTDKEIEAHELVGAKHELETIEATLNHDVEEENREHQQARLFLRMAVSKAIQASIVAIFSLMFITYSVVRLISGWPIAGYGRYVGVLERRHIVFVIQHQLIWLQIMLLMNQYLRKACNPVFVILGTALMSGFFQLLHSIVIQNQFPATLAVMGTEVWWFSIMAFMHTLICFFLLGELVVVDWHVRMALFAILVFSWTKFGLEIQSTWTAATTEETSTIATEASPLHTPSKNNIEGYIVFVEDAASVFGNGVQAWAMISWDVLVLSLGFRLFRMVSPVAWQVNPTATVFAEAFILFFAFSSIRWPVVDSTLPRAIVVDQ